MEEDHGASAWSATRARKIEEALARIGQPISETDARGLVARQDCDCKDGMFALAATRRQLFGGAALVAGVGMTAMLPSAAGAKAPPGAAEYPVQPDPTREPGRQMGEDGWMGIGWPMPGRTRAGVIRRLEIPFGAFPPSRAPISWNARGPRARS